MFFEPGFLGTRAALYLDVVTLYFALLPFLLFYVIRLAVKGDVRGHYRGQFAVLFVSIFMVVVFEIGVRLSGGFAEFVRESRFPYDFMVGFLAFHILISLASVTGWVVLIYRSFKRYRAEGNSAAFSVAHKRAARWVFAGIAATSLTGCMVYGFLFL